MSEEGITESTRKREKKTESKAGNELSRLLAVRQLLKSKKPDFIRQESWKYKKLSSSWRRPKGIDSKMRTKEHGWPKSVGVGYGSPKKVCGFHPSGFKETIVHNVNDLININSDIVVRISHTVGNKKRLEIVEKAKELKLHVVNAKEVNKVESTESEKASS
ncbi:MAG: large subunit ribosomal protein L32e [Thermoproteota archaeon]|nr:large subunit ribosomal protein L32e [Thermoproteota archaeon]